jgi:hypothetical protein
VSRYTTLKPVGSGAAQQDRIMCTEMEAWWQFGKGHKGNYGPTNERIAQTLIGLGTKK